MCTATQFNPFCQQTMKLHGIGKKCQDVSALQIGKQVEIFMLVLFLVSRGTRLASLSGCSENFKLILSGVS
jgi:hypothetical protein